MIISKNEPEIVTAENVEHVGKNLVAHLKSRLKDGGQITMVWEKHYVDARTKSMDVFYFKKD